MGSLANQYISQSYISLIHLGSDTTISSSYTDLQDGLGNTLNISVNAQGDISASGNIFAANLSTITYDTGSLLTTASFNNGTRNLTFTKGNGSTFAVNIPDASGSVLPAGTVSGSAQIAALGFISSSVTSSMAVSSSLYAVTASLAREVIISAINANQSTLPIGTVVRISGANGDNPNFNTASFIDEANSSNTLGVLAHTAVSGQYADITVIGKLIGVNTQGMNAGDLIYLSSSGQFTNVQPQAPLQIVILGEVLRVQQNNGSIFVNVSNGWELNELHNVRITNPLQGDVLVYEATSSLWKNRPSSSFATSAITASSLITASINNATNTITFTKGNGTTFDILVQTGSLAGINTGSFATTGSNTFTGVQNFNGNITSSANVLINGDLTVNPTTSTKLNGNADVGAFLYVNSGITMGNTAATITWLGTGGIDGNFSQSVDSRLDRTATTGSNTFIGNQSITSTGNTDLMLQSTAISGQTNLVLDAFQNNLTSKGNFSFTNNGQFGGSGSMKYIVKDSQIEFAATNGFRFGVTNSTGNGIDNSGLVSINVFSGSQSMSLTGSLDVSNSFTSSTARIEQTLKLDESNPLPTGQIGMLAVSASNLYFFSGSAWNKIAFA